MDQLLAFLRKYFESLFEFLAKIGVEVPGYVKEGVDELLPDATTEGQA